MTSRKMLLVELDQLGYKYEIASAGDNQAINPGLLHTANSTPNYGY